MSIVLDTNMKMFADRMSIPVSRMIQDYGLKTVDEIIEAEAEKGNTTAINYAREMYSSPEKLIQIFRLNDVENKFNILSKMDDHTREMVLPLLDSNDLVMGLYFFTQDKLLDLLSNVDIEELVRVVLNAFPLPDIIAMFSEDDLAGFFQQRELEKYEIVNQLKCMPPDIMQKFVEGVTGRPSEETNPIDLINSLDALPEDKFRDFMSLIDPDVQRQLTFQLTQENPERLELFPAMSYINMLGTMYKQDMIKPMINLEKDTLMSMNLLLSDELLSIVESQVDTQKFANFLLDGHLEALEEALMI